MQCPDQWHQYHLGTCEVNSWSPPQISSIRSSRAGARQSALTSPAGGSDTCWGLRATGLILVQIQINLIEVSVFVHLLPGLLLELYKSVTGSQMPGKAFDAGRSPKAGSSVPPGVRLLNKTNIWKLYWCIFSRGEWVVEGKVTIPFLFENV